MVQKAGMKSDDVHTICVVGLGYVGYPLAKALAEHYDVIGFDLSLSRLKQLANEKSCIRLTSDPGSIREADVVIICVPTPVTRTKEPDLSPIRMAAAAIGGNLKKGATVVLESTVYPGLTEEYLVPLLEEHSGTKCGIDFKVGYSPERVNPGDNEHILRNIIKIVAGMDEETTSRLESIYGKISNTYRVSSIRTAEAAKVIENIQRDLNIALVNELTIIMRKMGLDTKEVLDAAATKWNFARFDPGMVGGHCIPVDPYYLVYKAKELGYHPQVILAGRAINDSMPEYIANMAIKGLNESGRVIRDSKILVLGLTYKSNVSDIRETPAKGVIAKLREFKPTIYGFDPLLEENVIKELGCIPLPKGARVDCAIITVAHAEFKRIDLDAMLRPHGVIIDVKRCFDGKKLIELGHLYHTL